MAKRPPPNDGEEGPLRTCLVTRQRRAPVEMIRFVLSPEAVVTPDIRNRLPGRGVWISASRSTISEAARRKVFSHGFKGAANVGGDLAIDVEQLLETDALGLLSLANKAGAVVTGFGKVEGAITSGEAAIVVHASDAAADGIRKLGQATRRAGRSPETVKLFPAARLGLALGRPHVIHAALKNGAAGEGFLVRCQRLQAFRGDTADDESGQRPGFSTDE